MHKRVAGVVWEGVGGGGRVVVWRAIAWLGLAPSPATSMAMLRLAGTGGTCQQVYRPPPLPPPPTLPTHPAGAPSPPLPDCPHLPNPPTTTVPSPPPCFPWVGQFSLDDTSATVTMGQTRVVSVVAATLEAPYPDRPTEGALRFNVEFSPMASPAFEPGRPGEDSIEVARLLDRGLRQSRAVDQEALCVVAGRKVRRMERRRRTGLCVGRGAKSVGRRAGLSRPTSRCCQTGGGGPGPGAGTGALGVCCCAALRGAVHGHGVHMHVRAFTAPVWGVSPLPLLITPFDTVPPPPPSDHHQNCRFGLCAWTRTCWTTAGTS